MLVAAVAVEQGYFAVEEAAEALAEAEAAA
jgi:hypothetical protein